MGPKTTDFVPRETVLIGMETIVSRGTITKKPGYPGFDVSRGTAAITIPIL